MVTNRYLYDTTFCIRCQFVSANLHKRNSPWEKPSESVKSSAKNTQLFHKNILKDRALLLLHSFEEFLILVHMLIQIISVTDPDR